MESQPVNFSSSLDQMAGVDANKVLHKAKTLEENLKDRTTSHHEKNNSRHHLERRNRELLDSGAEAVKISFTNVRFTVTINATREEKKAG